LKIFLILGFTVFAHSLIAQTEKPIKLKHQGFIPIQVAEPSDICMHPNGQSYFIVSDNGFLYEMDTLGRIIRKADYKGLDTEAVHVYQRNIYVVEEMSRKIRVFDIDSLILRRTVKINYEGGRNKGFEAFAFNEARQRFVIVTEKDPIYLFELDNDLNVVNEILLDKIAGDISAATWYNGSLWLLSDDDMQVIQINPQNYKVVNRFALPVINPEGITFNSRGEMIIVSDDLQRLYKFEKLPN